MYELTQHFLVDNFNGVFGGKESEGKDKELKRWVNEEDVIIIKRRLKLSPNGLHRMW